jgi:ABC-type multidrug transport system fused ATPase/permease subunit
MMSDTQIHRSGQYIWGIYALAVCGSAILTPLVLSQYGYSPLKVLLATILLAVCLYPTACYFANREGGLPSMAVLGLAYASMFVIPIFTREPTVQLAFGETAYLDDEYVVMVLLLSILGVCSLLTGFYGFQATRLAKTMPVIGLHLDEKKAVVYCVVAGLLVPVLARPEYIFPEDLLEQLSAVIRVLQSQALIAIAILGYLIYSGRGPAWYRAILYWIIGVTALEGLSNGMIEQAVTPVAVLFIIRWQVTKRLPLLSIIAMIVIIIFLSPVKHEYRRATWSQDMQVPDSTVDKAFLWLHQASQYWSDTLSGQRSLAESTEQTASRMDLIHQFALVRSLTPSEIPYQYGATYSYFLVTFIPRAIWPEKPEAGAANKFFAVSYGITTEEGAERSTFGVSLLAEGYINFGWVGIIFIMALQGALLCLLQHMFGEQKSGEGGWAVYVSFFVFFLNGIGSSADVLFGNIIQSTLLCSALLWWMRVKPSTQGSQETHLALPYIQK